MNYCECKWCEGHMSPEEEREAEARAERWHRESELEVRWYGTPPESLAQIFPVGSERTFSNGLTRKVLEHRGDSVVFGAAV